MTTRRLLIVSVASLAGGVVAFFFTWAGVDLGFLWCDGRFGPFEKPGCRLPWLYSWITLILLGLALAAVSVAIVRAWRRWSHRPRLFRW